MLQANSTSSNEAAKGRDCILLQTGLDRTGRFQEAVGEAIAKTFKAGHSESRLPMLLFTLWAYMLAHLISAQIDLLKSRGPVQTCMTFTCQG